MKTDEGFKNFTQGDLDKRGVKIVRDGKPVDLSSLRRDDRLTATIITSKPPRVMTEKEVNATLASRSEPQARAERLAHRPGLALPPPRRVQGRRARGRAAPRQDAPQDGQLMAASRARERPDARVGARPDTAAPLRSLTGSKEMCRQDLTSAV